MRALLLFCFFVSSSVACDLRESKTPPSTQSHAASDADDKAKEKSSAPPSSPRPKAKAAPAAHQGDPLGAPQQGGPDLRLEGGK